ncbi:MAG: MotA/TolQ/ExbB proton channel family protein [Deltaproteobacteria bacterium]|nr:MotA/TolQ/ExbB proton channel family protein [Deltaproteobacteria bacterium]
MGSGSEASWIVLVEWLSRLILLLLVGLSVWSIRLIVERWMFFKTLKSFDGEALELSTLLQAEAVRKSGKSSTWEESRLVWEKAFQSSSAPAGNEVASPYRRVFGNTSGLDNPDAFEKVVSSSLLRMRKEWEKSLPVLGTLGSTTPFIGLLGTVFGIIVSFGTLSSGNSDTFKVMASLAEALVLTAAGLAVAIPAVIANNYFTRKIIEFSRGIESLKELGMALRMKDTN